MLALLHSVPPSLQQATADPRLHWGLLDTPGQVLISLSWSHCSFLLGPGVQKVLFVPSSFYLFPQGFVCDLDSIFKSRDVTLPIKVCIVKTMFFFSSNVWILVLDFKEG